MSIRKSVYFAVRGLSGQPVGRHYERFLQQDGQGAAHEATKALLGNLLAHCRRHVPYYAGLMREAGEDLEDPEGYLTRLPILTKDIIRSRFDDLKSADLPRRRWYYNTSGGSTGEPARFIQDADYAVRSAAIKLLYSKLAGREIGQPEIRLWGSVRDIATGTLGWRAWLSNRLTGTTFLNAFQMTPARMREYVSILNAQRPRLIVAYVGPMYELARLAENEALAVVPQSAIITSGGTLYPFMREAMERVFQCKVYNRYGSREVGDIACERPGCEGLWVAPWGCYVEVVDGRGRRVPDGTEGEILVTSLNNLAMPLVRYRIGDRGVLAPQPAGNRRAFGQVLQGVLGRTHDLFPTQDGVLVDAGYFMHLLYFRDWIARYQVVQKSRTRVVFRIVRASTPPQAELDDIAAGTRLIMGEGCGAEFEFVDEIPASASGKYRFIISEVRSEHDS